MSISRKKFLQLSALTTASALVPNFLKAFAGNASAKINPNGKILVVLQLSGGNDGLNTVIPFRNDIYYQSRPQLAIKAENVLGLTDEIALNPALKGLKGLYDNGALTILNGVGYPHPDRSHFRSMDIWQTGSRSDEIMTTGWLGRYLDHNFSGRTNDVHVAIELDDSLSLSMKGKLHKALAVRDVNQFYAASRNPYFTTITDLHHNDHGTKTASYLYKTLSETISSADYIHEKYKLANSAQSYPDSPLAKRFKSIASLINADADTKVYYLSHGSFDTHVNQQAQQEKLFTQMDEALTAFVIDLKASGKMDDVLIVTFSEFGRRVAQNASNGTDHGTASNMFVIGSKLKKPGIYNSLPSLTDLDAGDLKHSLDFKQVYATLLDKWLDTDAKAVLGSRYEQLTFI